MTLLEAYACGKPVIASKTSALEPLVNGSGVLFESDNSQQLTHALLKVLSDDEGAIQMGLNGKAFAQANFSIEQVTGRFEALYREVISSAG